MHPPRPPSSARAARAARGATLAVLVWVAADALDIQKTAGVHPLYPFVVAAVAGALATTLSPRRGLRALQAAAALAALGLVLITALPITPALARTLVRQDRPTVEAGAPVDAVAVLSDGIGEDGVVQGQGLDRLLTGIALAKRTARPLVISVVHPPRVPAVSSLADQRRVIGLAGGVPQLWFVDSVYTTHDEALRMTALARARGWHRVALVTSPAHSRRACATFERAGLAVVCTPAVARDASWGGAQPLHSAGDRLRVAGQWLYESLGWLAYRARGWV